MLRISPKSSLYIFFQNTSHTYNRARDKAKIYFNIHSIPPCVRVWPMPCGPMRRLKAVLQEAKTSRLTSAWQQGCHVDYSAAPNLVGQPVSGLLKGRIRSNFYEVMLASNKFTINRRMILTCELFLNHRGSGQSQIGSGQSQIGSVHSQSGSRQSQIGSDQSQIGSD